MKIVLDTNVLVSGLLSPFNAPGEIVRMVSSGLLQLCYDARILSEYRGVLNRSKFNFAKHLIEALLDQIKATGHSVASEPLKKPLADRGDEAFLEVAIAGKVASLVTGNLRHFSLVNEEKIEILSPADFLIFYRKHKK